MLYVSRFTLTGKSTFQHVLGCSARTYPSMAIDYSSKDYWRTRLFKEKDVGFEWLVPSSGILSIIVEIAQCSTSCNTPLRVLHFGCGSSTLGLDLQHSLGDRVMVSDADYASASLGTRDARKATVPTMLHVPLLEVDVLDLISLRDTAPTGGWDLFVDKSTADAISCSPPLERPSATSSTAVTEVEALQVLCDNLGQVSSPRSRWISISYSSNRFDFLASDSRGGWRVLDKFPARLEASSNAMGGHVVHRPVTGTWVWVLGRE